MLLAEATEKTIASRRKSVKQLRRSVDQEHLCDEASNLSIASEQPRDLVSKCGEYEHVDKSQDRCPRDRDTDRSPRNIGLLRTDEIAHPSRRRDAESKLTLEHQHGQGLQHAICREMYGTDPRGRECEDFEGEVLGQDHDEAVDG